MMRLDEGSGLAEPGVRDSDGPEVTWWLVGLTGRGSSVLLSIQTTRLVPPRGAWEASVAGTDVVLVLGAGAPLRVRGTSPLVAERMFG